MRTELKIRFAALVAWMAIGLGLFNARAFSLLGPEESWMALTNGFQRVGDIGGPKNLGEEYRWNVPVVTYAFDSSFVNCFGSNGVAAVEGAIQILNNLPPASQLDPGAYPPDSQGVNPTAQVQGLIDLKSETLFLLLQQLGLAQPQRFMFCVHDFSVTGGSPNAVVIMRNFDPITYAPTNALNGMLYTNNLDWQFNQGPWAVSVIAVAIPVSLFPIGSFPLPVTAVADGGAGMFPGWFYTGLTSDDAGGLRYLLQTNNYNLESLLPDVQGAGTNAGNYVNVAVRGGVDKISFVQETVDLITGQFFSPVTNQYTDFYLTNGVVRQQQLERVTTRPDVIFSAYDDVGEVPVTVATTGTTNWLNNGLPGLGGPGTIRPQVTIAFPKYGLQAQAITSDTAGVVQASDERWASFDASTNPPVIYPAQTGPGAGNPWTLHVSVVNNNYQPLRGGYFAWQLPAALGTAVLLETSTNLADWTPVATATNYGIPFFWEHLSAQPSEFYRAVPQ